jgi:hypothetical protein
MRSEFFKATTRQRQKLYQFLDCHGGQSPLAMTTNDHEKMGNGNGILETATPHPALSRRGRGNDHDHDHGKSFISFWIAAGDKAPSQ